MLRKILLVPLLLPYMLTSCGSSEMKVSDRANQKSYPTTNGSEDATATTGSSQSSSSANDADDDSSSNGIPKFKEAGIQLAESVNLDSLSFSSVTPSVNETSIADYMDDNNLSVSLLVFCNQTSAACRLVARDLTLSPIAKDNKNFAVIGVNTDAIESSYVLPEYTKFDDHESAVLFNRIMQHPETDLTPYFVLVFRGQTKQGIVWRTSIDQVLHKDLTKKVNDFLALIGA